LLRQSGGLIETLFVDAAKSWELTNSICAGYARHVIPDAGRIIVQDFRDPFTHWLPLVFDSQPEVWREVESVADGTTVTFVLRAGGQHAMRTDHVEASFPLERAERLIRARLARELPAHRNRLLRGLYRKTGLERDEVASARIAEELAADRAFPTPTHELEQLVQPDLPELRHGWSAFLAGDPARARDLAGRCLAAFARPPFGALLLHARASAAVGDADSAARSLETVLTRCPDVPGAAMFSAEVRIARGEKAEAESDVLQELRNVAHDESMIELGLSILARLWAADQRIADAAARVDELSRALPHSPTVWIACAQAQRLLGHDAEAAQALFRALALAPQHPMARRLEAAWS
jgi:hypothetical protein